MSVFKDLESLSGKKFFQYIILIGFLICPFYVFLFLYCRGIFISFNPILVIILSASLSFPIFAFNVLLAGMIEFSGPKPIKNIESSIGISAWLSIFPIYLFILIAYFWSWKTKQVIISICVWEILLFIVSFIRMNNNKMLNVNNISDKSSIMSLPIRDCFITSFVYLIILFGIFYVIFYTEVLFAIKVILGIFEVIMMTMFYQSIVRIFFKLRQKS